MPDLTPLLLIAAARFVVSIFEATKIYLVSTRGSNTHLWAGLASATESILWLTIVAGVVQDPTPPRIAAYAIGVGVGQVAGLRLLGKLRLGRVAMRAFITDTTPEGEQDPATDVANDLRAAGYGATVFRGEGSTGPVAMILSVVARKRLTRAVETVHASRHDAFVTIDNDPAPGSSISGAVGPRRL